MHQTRKRNQWYFGMKAHAGVDSETGLVHSMTATAASVHDVAKAHKLRSILGIHPEVALHYLFTHTPAASSGQA